MSSASNVEKWQKIIHHISQKSQKFAPPRRRTDRPPFAILGSYTCLYKYFHTKSRRAGGVVRNRVVNWTHKARDDHLRKLNPQRSRYLNCTVFRCQHRRVIS